MKIGDRIVYPMHGAGEIGEIEENEVGGVIKSYYVLKMPMGSMKLMLPVDKIAEMGLREVIDSTKLADVEKVLGDEPEIQQGSWNKRYHANLDRMKTGDICEVAAIVRNLARHGFIKKLSSGEHRLLESAKQILVSELIYVLEKSPEEVSAWVDEKIKAGVKPEENLEE